MKLASFRFKEVLNTVCGNPTTIREILMVERNCHNLGGNGLVNDYSLKHSCSNNYGKKLVYALVNGGASDNKMLKHLNSEKHALFLRMLGLELKYACNRNVTIASKLIRIYIFVSQNWLKMLIS
jgi:hypothetical protein